MSVKHGQVSAYAHFLIFLILTPISFSTQASLGSEVGGPKSAVEFITAEELKSKIAKKEPVTIIDVRSADNYAASNNKIKGAIRVKLRRLKARLAFPPLKDVPRSAEVITYCASTGDEYSMRAAEVLLEAGFTRVRVLKGGWQDWQKARGQVEPRPKAP